MMSGTKKKKSLKVKVEFTQFTTYKDFLRFLLNVRYSPIAITMVLAVTMLGVAVSMLKKSKRE